LLCTEITLHQEQADAEDEADDRSGQDRAPRNFTLALGKRGGGNTRRGAYRRRR
jgi:hypothetical protein